MFLLHGEKRKTPASTSQTGHVHRRLRNSDFNEVAIVVTDIQHPCVDSSQFVNCSLFDHQDTTDMLVILCRYSF